MLIIASHLREKQRIAIGYIVAALCEIWFSSNRTMIVERGMFKNYQYQWYANCFFWVIMHNLNLVTVN